MRPMKNSNALRAVKYLASDMVLAKYGSCVFNLHSCFFKAGCPALKNKILSSEIRAEKIELCALCVLSEMLF